MANILADDVYNKAMNEEVEMMDKKQIKAPEVNPSPKDVETDATVKAKALGEATAEVEVGTPGAPGPEVNPATSPNKVETNATVKSKALGKARAQVEEKAPAAAGPEVNPTTSPNNVETDAMGKAKELS